MNDNGINDDPVPIGDSEGTAPQVVTGLEPISYIYKGTDGLMYRTQPVDVSIVEQYPLYSAADVAKLQADLAAMTQERDDMLDVLQSILLNPSEEAYWLTQLQTILGEKK